MEERIQYKDVVKKYRNENYGTTLQESFEKGKLFRTLKQIQEDQEKEPKPKMGYWWGSWLWSEEDTLDLFIGESKNEIFFIRMSSIKTMKDVLENIYYVGTRSWATMEIIGGLLIALIDIKGDIIDKFMEEK